MGAQFDEKKKKLSQARRFGNGVEIPVMGFYFGLCGPQIRQATYLFIRLSRGGRPGKIFCPDCILLYSGEEKNEAD